MTDESQLIDSAEKTVDVSPGYAISQVRQARNMTTAEVAQHLKFSVKQIEALEADDYGKLHGSTLVRGMIRSYAKLLQLDLLMKRGKLIHKYLHEHCEPRIKARKSP